MVSIPVLAAGEFDPSGYETITQEQLASRPEAHAGKRFQVTDAFQFCGSDFCVQILKTKINTKDYYCFALGSVCLVRMYLKKDHADASLLLKLKKGDRVSVYGTFDYVGSNYKFLVVDRIAADRSP